MIQKEPWWVQFLCLSHFLTQQYETCYSYSVQTINSLLRQRNHLIFQKCCQNMGSPCDESKFCNCLNFLCRFSCITAYDITALAITILWLSKLQKWPNCNSKNIYKLNVLLVFLIYSCWFYVDFQNFQNGWIFKH